MKVCPVQRFKISLRPNLRVEASPDDSKVAQVSLTVHVGQVVLLHLDEETCLTIALLGQQREVRRMQRFQNEAFLTVGDVSGKGLF
jgi:hypothetical protein